MEEIHNYSNLFQSKHLLSYISYCRYHLSVFTVAKCIGKLSVIYVQLSFPMVLLAHKSSSAFIRQLVQCRSHMVCSLHFSIFTMTNFRCVIAVCADRLIGIKHPLYIRSHVAGYKIKLLIATIVLFPGIFTAYQHVAHTCLVRSYCRGTQLYSKCLPVNQP